MITRKVWTYQINRGSTSKNEINGAFNVAVLEEMVAPVITDSVLISFYFAVKEGCLVAGDPQCSCLSSGLPMRPWCRVL